MSQPVVQGAVLAAHQGTVVYESYEGWADRAAEAPVTARTGFQIASVSKQFAAAAVLLLCESGRLSPDATIARWFGTSPCAGITVHQLLTHTSGLGHWQDYPWVAQRSWTDSSELADAFVRTPPPTSPDRQWRYSSPGYVLLSTIVERVADEPYAQFLREQVFEPLGMADTGAGRAPGPDDGACGYVGDAAAESVDVGVLYAGAGDVWSTARDLLRWDVALAGGEVLTESARSAMFTAHVRTGPDSQEHYGYGWVLGSLAGRPARYHLGDNPGFCSGNAWLTTHDGYAIVLSNQQESNVPDALAGLIESPVFAPRPEVSTESSV